MDFCKLTSDERKELALHDDERQLDDIENAVSVFPLLDIKIECEVAGEKEIAVGDILTIRIHITQTNLKEGQQAGFIHSN